VACDHGWPRASNPDNAPTVAPLERTREAWCQDTGSPSDNLLRHVGTPSMLHIRGENMRRIRWQVTLCAALAVGAVLFGCGGDDPDNASCADDCFGAPPAVCDGNVRITYAPLGTCVAGACVFPESTIDCEATGATCVGGTCVGGSDPCDDVSCDAPPEATCDGHTAVTYTGAGRCVASSGMCEYDVERRDCTASGQECRLGDCVSVVDPCDGVACTTPPSRTCDGTSVVTYATEGACDGGTCSYPVLTSTDCAESGEFCLDGRCQEEDPCLSLVCETPPGPTCDGTVATTYAALGTCTAGACVYGADTQECADNGQVCREGLCVTPSPCDGVVCASPPPERCDGAVAVTFDASGTCTDGTCSYDETQTNCAAVGEVCVGGACLDPNVCNPALCTDPPDTTCDGDRLISYGEPGTCDGGVCVYSEVEVDCADSGFICLEGACESPAAACLPTDCATIPEPLCAGSLRVTYDGVGACEDGECVYPTTVVDCDDLGLMCAGGECVAVDPCEGVTCPSLPAMCDGERLVEASDPGVCLFGACEYDPPAPVDCPSGSTCSMGRCARPGELLTAGELIISEILRDGSIPGDTAVHYIELYEPTGTPLNLDGLRVQDGAGNEITLPSTARVAGGGAFLVTSSAALVALVDLDPERVYVWEPGALDIGGTEASIVIQGAEEVARVDVDATWGFETGRSLQLNPTAISVEDPSLPLHWCSSGDISTITAGLAGTPGRLNRACSGTWDVGDLFVSEFLPGVGETGGSAFVEVFANFSGLRSLAGLSIGVSGQPYEIVLPPGFDALGGASIVVSSFADLPAFDVLIDPDLHVPVTGGTIIVSDNGGTLAQLTYTDAWPFVVGESSAQLTNDPVVRAEEDVTSMTFWCASTDEFGSDGLRGTPGQDNNVCP